MIIKTRDATPDSIRALESRSVSANDPVTRSACRSAAARLRSGGIGDEACRLVDSGFGDASDWAVLHDLRLDVGSHAIQIDHLLVNDHLEWISIDSRYLQYGLEFLADGRCHAYRALGSMLVASPVTKAARDARMLGTLLAEREILPRRFGIGPRPTTRAIVLTNPALRVGNRDALPAARSRPDATAGVCVAGDALFPLLWKQQRRRVTNLFERVSAARLEQIARQVAALHCPAFPPSLLAA